MGLYAIFKMTICIYVLDKLFHAFDIGFLLI